MIIAFVGYSLSGKSTASEVAKELGIPVVNMGDVIREEATKRGLEQNSENLGKIADEIRKKEGIDAIAKRCIPKIRSHGPIVLVDGIRGIDEIRLLKKEFKNIFIISIEAPLEVRFQRARQRKRSDDVLRIEELIERDKREESWGIKKAMEIADLTIENVGDLESFIEKIRAVLKKLMSVEIEIETFLHPTEDTEKVVKAVKNLFPDAKIEIENGKLFAVARSVRHFKELLKKQRILDTARSELLRGRKENEIIIFINKQAATVSRINFCDEDAVLSPLRITFRLINVPFQRFLAYLTPITKDGKPINEIEEL
ncbi:MAG: AAA family ATPase [Archaeoglobaceae archaeon]|nr:AAA family ATPase [Archaeoglobaceae archaeon]MDW7990173.1 AAA family ATPase [Archaeoglobaceae archaeon]